MVPGYQRLPTPARCGAILCGVHPCGAIQCGNKTMKLFDRIFKRNQPEPEVPSWVPVEPVRGGFATDLDPATYNACHKLLTFRKLPLFSSFNSEQMKLEAEKTFKEIHFGPGYKPELVDYVWSGQYEADREK